eukprot:COSAG01_NODE_67554_length_266_cov_2.131737_1_plen_30_part_10
MGRMESYIVGFEGGGAGDRVVSISYAGDAA